MATANYNKHFHAGPGRQELYNGSGVFISKVEINNIHTEASKRPTEILNKLVGHFFDLQTLASQRESLDDTIVHACTGICAMQLFLILRFFYTLFRAIFILLESTYFLLFMQYLATCKSCKLFCSLWKIKKGIAEREQYDSSFRKLGSNCVLLNFWELIKYACYVGQKT